MWTSDSDRPLLGCGIDVEHLQRFDTLCERDDWPWTLVFSEREIEHCRHLPHPATGYCAAFCAKEALLKALTTLYPLTECELCYEPGLEVLDLRLSGSLREQHGIASADVRVSFGPTGDCVAILRAFRTEGSLAAP